LVVEASLAYILNRKAIAAGVRGILRGKPLLEDEQAGPLGLACGLSDRGRNGARRGQRNMASHAYDQWSVDELLGLAKGGQLRPETRFKYSTIIPRRSNQIVGR